MSDYSNFPKEKTLINILEECPRSALVYLKLWEIKDKSNKIKFRKKEVRKKFFISNTVLRNHLYALEAARFLDFSYIVIPEDDEDANIIVSLNV